MGNDAQMDHMDHMNMDQNQNHHHGDSNDVMKDVIHEAHTSGHSMAFNVAQPFTMLFQSWKISSDKELAWTCVVLGLLCIIYEGIKVAKQTVRRKYGNITEKRSRWTRLYSCGSLLTTFLHFVQV